MVKNPRVFLEIEIGGESGSLHVVFRLSRLCLALCWLCVQACVSGSECQCSRMAHPLCVLSQRAKFSSSSLRTAAPRLQRTFVPFVLVRPSRAHCFLQMRSVPSFLGQCGRAYAEPCCHNCVQVRRALGRRLRSRYAIVARSSTGVLQTLCCR
jgi:hypothetical protein